MDPAVRSDVTQAAVAELRASEARMRALFDTTNQGVAIMQLVRDDADNVVDARYLEVNPAFERLTGLDRAAVVGRRSSEVFPLDFVRWQPRLATVDGTAGPERFETFIPEVGRWFSCYAAPLDGPDDFAVFFDDVSDRKQREDQQAFLLTLSDALRPLTDAAAIQQTAARVLGEHLGVIRAMYAEVEGEPGAEVGTLRGQYHRPEDPASEPALPPFPERYSYSRYGERVMALRRRGETMVVADVATDERFEADERAAWLAGGVRAAVTVALVKGGRFVADFGVQSAAPRDWTPGEVALVEETAERTWTAVERARAEAELRVTEARFRAVAELVPDLLWDVEPDGSTSWFNERWAEYSGQTLDEALRRGWMGLIHPDDRERSAASYVKAIASGETLLQEHRFRRHDGAYRWFLVRAEPLRSADGRIVRWFVAATDINAQRMALEEAERLAAERTAERDALRRQLFEAEEVERRRLARELHDEAGQHLTAIGLGLQTLSDMTPPGSEVDRRATQLRALVATMSQELHSLAVRLRPKSLDDFGLEAALAAYAEEWSRQTGIAVGVHGRAGADRLPSAIESAVYRVVQEALTNVARHSGAMHASVIVERRDGQVHAIVEDDGRGFDAEALSGGQSASGGLGLRGMRERAALLGGLADVESSPGAGTTVFVRIPLDEPATRRSSGPSRSSLGTSGG